MKSLAHYIMKNVTIILSIFAITLSACTTRFSQETEIQFQTSAYQTAQAETNSPERSDTIYPARSLWGGFLLNSADGSRGVSSTQGNRGLWGGFPLRRIANNTDTSSSFEYSSFSSSCESTDGFCIIEHRFPFRRPFSSDFNTAIAPSYPYGSTQFEAHPPHHGVEILNPTGTPVLAVADGTVIVAGNDAHSVYGPWENFYGNLVVLEHHLLDIGEPIYTLYGHLSTIDVQVGQELKSGDQIGAVGYSGRAIGSHLHFEVRVGVNQYTTTHNPALWLFPFKDESDRQYGLLAGKIVNAKGNPIYLTVKVEYYPDINEPFAKKFYIETYAPDVYPFENNNIYQENFVLADLLPGYYRISLSISGKWIERWVEVKPGEMSFVTIKPR